MWQSLWRDCRTLCIILDKNILPYFFGITTKRLFSAFLNGILFSSRYEGNAEQSIWKVVKLQAGTAATRKGKRCLFFGGIGMPAKMKSYAFTNSGVRYSCPAIAQQEQRTKWTKFSIIIFEVLIGLFQIYVHFVHLTLKSAVNPYK